MAQPGDDWPRDWPPLAVEVPDDARELAEDVAAYRRELRSQRRHERLNRWLAVDRWRKYGIAGPIGVVALVVVASVGSLLALVVPSSPHTPAARPLANPSTPIGKVGGLLPTTSLDVAGQKLSTRSPLARPAVFALVSKNCDCKDVITRLAAQAGEYRLPLLLVVNGDDDPIAESTAQSIRETAVTVAYDHTGQLTWHYGVDGADVTAVLVRDDGVVSAVLPVDTTTTVENQLIRLAPTRT